jgi:hypothetical protein
MCRFLHVSGRTVDETAPTGNAVKHFSAGKLGFRGIGEYEKSQIP